jgi:hypothetical protein
VKNTMPYTYPKDPSSYINIKNYQNCSSNQTYISNENKLHVKGPRGVVSFVSFVAVLRPWALAAHRVSDVGQTKNF